LKCRELFTVDEITNEVVHLGARDKDALSMSGFAKQFFSECKCGLYDKASDFF
jgi:hypothetical protein